MPRKLRGLGKPEFKPQPKRAGPTNPELKVITGKIMGMVTFQLRLNSMPIYHEITPTAYAALSLLYMTPTRGYSSLSMAALLGVTGDVSFQALNQLSSCGLLSRVKNPGSYVLHTITKTGIEVMDTIRAYYATGTRDEFRVYAGIFDGT